MDTARRLVETAWTARRVEIGIFAKIFPRPTLEATLDAVQSHGIHTVQFNMACAGVPTLPESIKPELCDHIIRETTRRDIRIAALSGTYNMIDPNHPARADGLVRLRVLAQAASRMGIPIVTVCTGTRDPDYMWRKHPDNTTKDAWSDLLASMEAACVIAQENNIILGVEPELSNVIDTASKARQLLDVLNTPHVKIVMDGSNLLNIHEVAKMPAIFNEAFDLLGGDICLVHAKDLMPGEGASDAQTARSPVGTARRLVEIESHGAAGTGVLDYDLYLHLLEKAGYTGPLILHTLREDEVDSSVAFLRAKLNARAARRLVDGSASRRERDNADLSA